MSEIVIDEEKETGGFGADDPGAVGRLVAIVAGSTSQRSWKVV